MKRFYNLIIAAFLCVFDTFAGGWCNVQGQYDFGHKYGTITFEGQHFDKIGNGYGFADFDCDPAGGQSGVYLEYGYNFGIFKGLSARVEYNGGVLFENGYTYAHGALAGLSYAALVKDCAFETQLQYRMDIDYQTRKLQHGLQITQVWSCYWFNRHLFFGGAIDLNIRKGNFSFNTEPQLLGCFDRHAIGIEVEVENWTGKVQAYPKVMYRLIIN